LANAFVFLRFNYYFGCTEKNEMAMKTIEKPSNFPKKHTETFISLFTSLVGFINGNGVWV